MSSLTALSEKEIGASVVLGEYEETVSLSLLEAMAPVAIPAKRRMQFVIAPLQSPICSIRPQLQL